MSCRVHRQFDKFLTGSPRRHIQQKAHEPLFGGLLAETKDVFVGAAEFTRQRCSEFEIEVRISPRPGYKCVVFGKTEFRWSQSFRIELVNPIGLERENVARQVECSNLPAAVTQHPDRSHRAASDEIRVLHGLVFGKHRGPGSEANRPANRVECRI